MEKGRKKSHEVAMPLEEVGERKKLSIMLEKEDPPGTTYKLFLLSYMIEI